MNNGKICISVCAKTADEVMELVRDAEPLADVIEVRFDCVESSESEKTISALNLQKPVLFTYRPACQGGSAADDMMPRIMFWMGAIGKSPLEADKMWIDNELDFGEAMQWAPETNVIRSFHDFNGVPNKLDSIYEQLSSSGIAKIAVTAKTITDSIPLWNLLDPTSDKSFIPIAMGEAGKWTRILGLAHGAFMTYASLDSGTETAPGQISAVDLIDVFRVKEIDRETQVYGVLAGDTSYSISPWIHNAGFKAAGMNRVFVPLQVEDIDEFFRRMVKKETREVDLNFAGFSVTNPHKQSIMPWLDEIDGTAAKIGAVNTVKIEDGKFFGYNTDAPGFIAPLKEHFGDLKNVRVSVFGAGGAARACIYALIAEGADVSLFARDTNKASALGDTFNIPVHEMPSDTRPINADILVNTTPLGTKGDVQDKTIVGAEQLKDVKLVYDLVYNPTETRLIHEATSARVPAIGGLEMLIAQGAKQFEIWTDEPAPLDAMTDAVKKKLNL